jgi:hypothetical protein
MNIKRSFRVALESLWHKSLFFAIETGVFSVPVPRLDDVQIELNSHCNRKCRFCPNSSNTREPGFLPDDLFYKIIADLKEVRFRGNMCFNLFNEPLLDKRLAQFMTFVNKELPAVRLYLNTNGDYMDIEMWKKLRNAGLKYANITQYDGKISDNIRQLIDNLPVKERACINAHVQDEGMLHNWAGKVTLEKKTVFPLNKYCDRPFRQLSINYKGKAVLCCADYFGEVEAGDMQTQSVRQVWRSEVFARYRRHLLGGHRENLKLCSTCSAG